MERVVIKMLEQDRGERPVGAAPGVQYVAVWVGWREDIPDTYKAPVALLDAVVPLPDRCVKGWSMSLIGGSEKYMTFDCTFYYLGFELMEYPWAHPDEPVI